MTKEDIPRKHLNEAADLDLMLETQYAREFVFSNNSIFDN